MKISNISNHPVKFGENKLNINSESAILLEDTPDTAEFQSKETDNENKGSKAANIALATASLGLAAASGYFIAKGNIGQKFKNAATTIQNAVRNHQKNNALAKQERLAAKRAKAAGTDLGHNTTPIILDSEGKAH